MNEQVTAVRAERDTLATEARTILDRSTETLSEEDKTRFTAIEARLDELKTREDQLNRLLSAAAAGHVERGDGAGDGQRVRDESSAGLARAAIDAAATEGLLPDHAAQRATALVDRGDSEGLAAQWARAAGDRDYLSAFTKLLVDKERGHMLWTPAEQEAYRRAAQVRAAMGTGTGVGGEMIPLSLDPAIMLTGDGSVDPLRRLARVVQTATNSWQGVTSAGATAEWKAEHAEAADGSPAVDDAPIPVHLGDVDVLYSYEVGMDAVNFISELRTVITDAADQLQATAFAVGSGVGQPAGVVTGATTTVDTAGSLAASHVYELQNALPPRFQSRAAFAGNLAVLNELAQFETTNGALKFPEVGAGRLLRRPLEEVSNMTDDLVTAGEKVLAYGDFSQFVIVDRVGATLEILPNFGANRRPTAERHAFLTFRTGSKVVVPQAFRVLTVTV